MKKAIAIMSVLIGVVACATPIKSMLGADGVEMVEVKENVNPYITDGLVAMWDGEWNAGIGIHNANIGILVDLCGTGNDFEIIPEHGQLLSNCIYCDGISSAAKTPYYIQDFSQMQVEIVYKIVSAPYGANAILVWLLNGGKYSGDACFLKLGLYARYSSGIGFSSRCGIRRNPLTGEVYSESVSCDISNGINAFAIGVYENGELKDLMLGSIFSGCAGVQSPPSLGVTCEGYVYSIRVYSRILTEEEILYNYNIDVERFGL